MLFYLFYLELETEVQQNLKHGVYRIIGKRSIGPVSVEMSSGGQESCSFIPRWNEEAATLEAFEQRVKLFVSSKKVKDSCVVHDFSPRSTQKETHFRYVRDNLTDKQLEAADGSSAQMIVKTIIRLSLSWSQVNPRRCTLVVGFLQARCSATK